MQNDTPTAAIITVADGCGFVVESARGRLVITAGHCLPSLPPCHCETPERTYRALLGPLEARRQSRPRAFLPIQWPTSQ